VDKVCEIAQPGDVFLFHTDGKLMASLTLVPVLN
jgi:hypothetical protein